MKSTVDKKWLEKLGVKLPIIQAPMAGADSLEMAVAVANAGGLGSLACAMLTPEQVRETWYAMRRQTGRPVNLNFFCHTQKEKSEPEQQRWRQILAPYYAELGLDPNAEINAPTRVPFDESYCAAVEEIRPQVLSFHFGLPPADLLRRVKATGALVLSSATTVEEALWLEQNGCDIVIAQGTEAGGHRGMFLTEDLSTQILTVDLLKQLSDVISIPVVAAGGIAGPEGVKNALSQGASAVQVGTAYLFCAEARVSPLYREALRSNGATALTNIFSGKPARGIVNRFIQETGPISADAPDFPYASQAVAPLRAASEKAGKADFMQMWSGMVRAPHEMNAGELTEFLGGGVFSPHKAHEIT